MTGQKKFKIAVVGMAFRLPGEISTVEALWRVLQQGENVISNIDESRFPYKNYLHERPTEPGKSYTFRAGVLSKVDEFDAAFFGISPREARQMDPQQRLLLETTWNALEHGGQNVDQLAGSDCAVYIGIGSFEHIFKYVNDISATDSYTMLGNCASIASNRISYAFDFHGPSVSIDTACSSSLVALHQACRCLWAGDASMAIAGGVNVLSSPSSFVGFSKASMLSPEGQCKSFSADAQGYVRSEGCVVLFLKPLLAAEAAGDPIHAVILNTGVNSDGRTHGITLPNAEAQAELITKVHEQAGVTADEVSYIEAHGTGTVVGDRSEARALGAALATKRAKNNPLLIGSIKSNVGHLEVVSGLTGVLKAILCLQHHQIPPTLHFTAPNPELDFDALNLKVVDTLSPLPIEKNPSIIGVNSFGFGGTNAHALFAAYDGETTPLQPVSSCPPLLLSVRDASVFPEMANHYQQLIKSNPDAYYDIAYASAHRARHDKGVVVYGDDLPGIIQALEDLKTETASDHLIHEQRLGATLAVALVYSGNGAQWQGMAAHLIQQDPLFIETIDEIDALFAEYAAFSIKSELLASQTRYDDTEIAQPCLFAIQVAITRYLIQKGLQISAVTGHSVGEIAAAWASGALSLQEAIKVLYYRSKGQGKTRGQGRMLAVALTVEAAEQWIVTHQLGERVVIAATNSPKGITLAGDLDALERVRAHCKAEGIFSRLLDLDYAFHTSAMDCIREELLASLDDLNPVNNTVPFVSTVTGALVSGETLDALYWWKNIRQPVRFCEAIDTLLDEGTCVFIEVGPHPILKPYIEESLRAREHRGIVIQTLKRHSAEVVDLKRAIFRTWLSGGQFDETHFFPMVGHPIALPPYPFVRISHTLTPTNESANQLEVLSDHPLLGRRLKAGEAIWENHLDPTLVRYLAHHQVDGVAVMPAAGFAEMALAVSLYWYGNSTHDLRDLEIISPMVFDEQSCRLTRFELQAESGHFVIKSRIRHTDDAWVLHVFGRLIMEPALSKPTQTIDLQDLQAYTRLDNQQLYAGAAAIGLLYGPMFQCIAEGWMQADRALARVAYPSEVASVMSDHCVYPGLLDACFQLLIGLLSYQTTAQGTVLPIRIGRLQQYRAVSDVFFLTAQIRTRSKQSVLADFVMLDKEGEVVALISDCRFKQTFFTHQKSVLNWYICKPHVLASSLEETTDLWDQVKEIVHQIKAGSSPVTVREEAHFQSVLPLVDLMVSHFIYQTIRACSIGLSSFSLSTLVVIAGIVPVQVPLLKWCLGILLEDNVLQKNDDEMYTFSQQVQTFDAHAVWMMLLNNHPEYVTEWGLLGRMGLHLKDVLCGDTREALHKRDALAHFQDNAQIGLQRLVQKTVQALLTPWPLTKRIRVLDLGHSIGYLTTQLTHLFPRDRTDYCLLVSDETVVHELENAPHVTILSWSHLQTDLEQLENHRFDLILVRNVLQEIDDPRAALMQLKQKLSNGGVLLATAHYSDRMHEFIYGSDPNWWHQTPDGTPHSRLYPATYWQDLLVIAGFHVTEPLFELKASQGEGAFLLIAGTPAVASLKEPQAMVGDMLLLTESEEAIQPFYSALKARQASVSVCLMKPFQGDLSAEALQVETLVQLLLPWRHRSVRLVWIFSKEATLQQALSDCTALVHLVKAIQGITWADYPRLTLVTSGALPVAVETTGVNPAHAMVWGVGRVLSNEDPALHCKLIDLQGAFSDALIAQGVEEIGNDDSEQEVIVTSSARFGVRIDKMDRTQPQSLDEIGYRLDFKRAGSLNHLHWFPAVNRPLASDEVLVKPCASGLNFRDVMYAMGLIPDEAVEEGFLGTTLGMEFAGQVLAVGDAVSAFAVGEAVMGFAPASFSSSTITKAHAITALPPQWSYATAATVPIAFFTAFYAIHHLARLGAGERILIHGAAGGVGIAAIQVAAYLGAEIYATAGSAEKRDFLHLMGVTHRYDSRTLLFADEILRDTEGEGVDVVLNCLAGEAVNANLRIIKPFGRFLELGKRDFFANSRIGLRPFRNNISYFGIDADQLLMKQPVLCVRLFKEIMALFATETFTPLPYRTFNTEQISETFRYMQQARQIGKIVVDLQVAPQTNCVCEETPSVLSLSNQQAYLVTGGLSGFGLKTAFWLVEKGARHLILVGRYGAVTEEAQQALQLFKQQGVNVAALAVDITDPIAVEAMIRQVHAVPLKGIIHAAAIYDDALMQNLTASRMAQVLAPKVQGAWNLHTSTLNTSLDFFVVYSSITTLFGNPGQANYVAANTYLESLIRHRRSAGLSGLFAAWGPISDVGYLARNESIKQRLTTKMGQQVLSADEALQRLEALLLKDIDGVAVGHLNINSMRRGLPTMRSPKFSMLGAEAEGDLSRESSEEIRLLLADKSVEEALTLVSHLLTHDIAKILRLPMEKIDKKASLLSIGMDSLVGAELGHAIEQRFAIQIPLLALSQGLSVQLIAERIISQIQQEEGTPTYTPEVTQLLSEAVLHGEDLSIHMAMDVVKELQPSTVS